MFDMRSALLFAIPLLVSALALFGLHWAPWNFGSKPLGRLTAYVTGTVVVVGMPVLAMCVAWGLALPHSELFWAGLLVTNTGVSGTVVRFAYWVDEQNPQAISLDEVQDAISTGR